MQKPEGRIREWSRMSWEEAMGTDGDLAPRPAKPTRQRRRLGAGIGWLLNVLLWAFLIVCAVLWGRILASDIDKEHALRSRLIRQESKQ